MSRNSNQPKELALHLVKSLWASVLEISERLQETKCVCESKWTEDYCQRIERTPTAEVVEHHPSQ